MQKKYFFKDFYKKYCHISKLLNLSFIVYKVKQGEAFRGDQAKDREGKEEFRFAIDAIAISGEWCVVAILVRKQGPLKIEF